jgi:hypothetical protein
MHVLVTICALARSILEGPRAVAFLAGNGNVQADERESREVVVEGNLLTPPLLVVALVAVGPKLPLMGIVLAVA